VICVVKSLILDYVYLMVSPFKLSINFDYLYNLLFLNTLIKLRLGSNKF